MHIKGSFANEMSNNNRQDHPPGGIYCSLAKEHLWAEHLTSLPKRVVGALSSVFVKTGQSPGNNIEFIILLFSA